MWVGFITFVVGWGVFDGTIQDLDSAQFKPSGVQQVLSSSIEGQFIKSELSGDELKSGEVLDLDFLYSNEGIHFRPLKVTKVLEDEEWVVVLAENQENSVFILWSQSDSVPSSEMHFEELIRRFVDDQLAEASSLEKFKSWKLLRTQLLGPLVEWRRGGRQMEVFRAGENLNRLAEEDSDLLVNSEPLIISLKKKASLMTAQRENSLPEF